MKITDVIDSLQKDIDNFGDEYVRSFKIVTRNDTTERKMISKTRKDKNGQSLAMNQKEFEAWIAEQESLSRGKAKPRTRK
jgi:hypothetical protein